MGNYKILKLNNESFDFLIIATSCNNPLNYIPEITNEIAKEQSKLLFDLTLINGTNSNRYISCDFNQNKNYWQSCYSVNDINEHIKKLSRDYFMKNNNIVEKGTIPKSLKFLLKLGLI